MRSQNFLMPTNEVLEKFHKEDCKQWVLMCVEGDFETNLEHEIHKERTEHKHFYSINS